MKKYSFNSIIDKSLSYDDITLIPKFSSFRSRNDADTSTTFGELNLKTPIISASMDTITESNMCVELYKNGALGCMHRFMSIIKNVEEYEKVKRNDAECIVSVGVKKEERRRFNWLFEAGARYFSIDIAHGHSILMKEMIEWIRSVDKNKEIICLIGGNIATRLGVYDIVSWGVDIVKCGISCGSICDTRNTTGFGIPQFSSLLECSNAVNTINSNSKNNVKLIADGGIKHSGDIVKAFVAGADYVMIGSLLAGTDETPSEILNNEKVYRGMSSQDAIKFSKKDEEFKPAPEGIATTVPKKGPVSLVINNLTLGLKSGMSYANAKTLKELRETEWSLQTPSGHKEGTPHILK